MPANDLVTLDLKKKIFLHLQILYTKKQSKYLDERSFAAYYVFC